MAQLTEKQRVILYRLAARQDEQGRETAHLRLSELEASELYKDLIDLEYLTFSQFGEDDKAIAQLIVTMKGERYCHEHLDELSALSRASWKLN